MARAVAVQKKALDETLLSLIPDHTDFRKTKAPKNVFTYPSTQDAARSAVYDDPELDVEDDTSRKKVGAFCICVKRVRTLHSKSVHLLCAESWLLLALFRRSHQVF